MEQLLFSYIPKSCDNSILYNFQRNYVWVHFTSGCPYEKQEVWDTWDITIETYGDVLSLGQLE